MQFEFDTSEYRSNHGAAPRGRGGWAFQFPGDEQPWFVPGPGCTLGEAKKAAKAEALRRFPNAGNAFIVITVCS